MIKQSLKFLNSFSLDTQNQEVFPRGQGNQINGAIITLDTVQVVNNPTIGEWFIVNLLPNKNVLHHITILISPRMSEFFNMYISSTCFSSSTPPTSVGSTTRKYPMFKTILRCLKYGNSTNGAGVRIFTSPSFATFRCLLFMFAVIFPSIFLCLFTHITIISQSIHTCQARLVCRVRNRRRMKGV